MNESLDHGAPPEGEIPQGEPAEGAGAAPAAGDAAGPVTPTSEAVPAPVEVPRPLQLSDAFATVDALYRYPIKGLSPERMELVELKAGEYFPGDRLYAIENGPSGFDPAAPKFHPKAKFLMLMRNERLAALETRYEDETTTLVIRHEGKEAVRGDLSTAEGCEAIEAFFQRFVRYELRGAPRLFAAPDGFRFVDTTEGYVSLINLASLGALEQIVGVPLNPLRFRANLYLDGMEPWEEFDLVGQTVRVGNSVLLKVTESTVRCAATNVDPETAKRDLDIPGTLMRTLGHNHCGVFAQILEGGLIAEGDQVRLVY